MERVKSSIQLKTERAKRTRKYIISLDFKLKAKIKLIRKQFKALRFPQSKTYYVGGGRREFVFD